jgi:hypothetical protein
MDRHSTKYSVNNTEIQLRINQSYYEREWRRKYFVAAMTVRSRMTQYALSHNNGRYRLILVENINAESHVHLF